MQKDEYKLALKPKNYKDRSIVGFCKTNYLSVYIKIKLLKMKNNLIIKILLLIICAITLSCQNDENQPEILKESLSINEAMDWVDKNFINNVSYSGIFKINTADSTVFDLKPLLNWNLAEIDNDSIWSIVELPWEYEGGFVKIANYEVKQQVESSHTDIIQVEKLVILKNRLTGDIYGFKMLVIPDLNYMLSNSENINTNTYFNRDNDLSGLVLFYSVKDEFINGWLYDKGMITERVINQNPNSKVNTSNFQKVSEGFSHYSIETCYYSIASGGGYTSEPKLMHCKTEYFSTNTEDDYLIGGGGGVDISGIGGGGTGSISNDTPADPCAENKKIKADQELIKRLKDYIEKSKKESIESGYMKTVSGEFIYPKYRDAKSVKYEYFFTEKITERVHLHPDLSGGTYIPSSKDILSLYSMFIDGRMYNSGTFRYIVVSSLGIGSLHITDPVAFENFGSKYTKESLDELFDATRRADNGMDSYLKQLLEVLKSSSSGLDFSLGEFEMESSYPNIQWNTKQIDALGNVVDLNCD